MHAVILAGGLGTRLSEETSVRPKPMVEIGERPILWHIMKHLATHGIEDFVICLGYRGDVIRDWFAAYRLHTSDVTLDLASGATTIQASRTEPWRVTLLETGLATPTGGRLKQALEHLSATGHAGTTLMTYGDGVSDVDVTALRSFHEQRGTLATVTAVQPPGRWGAIDLHDDQVTHFREKPRGDGIWANGGFFLLEPGVLAHLDDDATFEEEPLRELARAGQLSAYRHHGHWQVMDTLRDKQALQDAWDSGTTPWVTWE